MPVQTSAHNPLSRAMVHLQPSCDDHFISMKLFQSSPSIFVTGCLISIYNIISYILEYCSCSSLHKPMCVFWLLIINFQKQCKPFCEGNKIFSQKEFCTEIWLKKICKHIHVRVKNWFKERVLHISKVIIYALKLLGYHWCFEKEVLIWCLWHCLWTIMLKYEKMTLVEKEFWWKKIFSFNFLLYMT